MENLKAVMDGLNMEIKRDYICVRLTSLSLSEENELLFKSELRLLCGWESLQNTLPRNLRCKGFN